MKVLPGVGNLGRGVTQGPDIFVFWVQPVLLLLEPPPWPLTLELEESPADHPEPGPGPVAQTCVLWRLHAQNSGCAAVAAHHWGHGHHLQAAPELQSSYVQGRWPYVPRVSTLSGGGLCALGLNIFCWTKEEGELLKPRESPLIHTQCFTCPV